MHCSSIPNIAEELCALACCARLDSDHHGSGMNGLGVELALYITDGRAYGGSVLGPDTLSHACLCGARPTKDQMHAGVPGRRVSTTGGSGTGSAYRTMRDSHRRLRRFERCVLFL